MTLSSRSIEAEFDGKAAGYENGRLGPWYRAQADLVLEHVSPPAGSTVLDVGCGTGYLLRKMIARAPGISGLGLDLSGRMIERARERARIEGVEGLRFVVGDWYRLDPGLLLQAHGLRAVDLVCCTSAFHYLNAPREALIKMRQATRPGGRLLLLDRANDRSPLTRAWDIVHRAILRDTVAFYTSRELLELVEAAGYTEVRVIETVRRLFWHGKLSTSLVLLSATA